MERMACLKTVQRGSETQSRARDGMLMSAMMSKERKGEVTLGRSKRQRSKLWLGESGPWVRDGRSADRRQVEDDQGGSKVESKAEVQSRRDDDERGCRQLRLC